MNKITLVELVKKEASKLKKNATPQEIERLDFQILDPEHKRKCIYGQLTKDCFSTRAHELINKCAERVYEQDRRKVDFSHSRLNGKPKFETNSKYEEQERNGHFSPIECFITFKENQDNGNNEAIIDYLKGETKTLTFKKF